MESSSLGLRSNFKSLLRFGPREIALTAVFGSISFALRLSGIAFPFVGIIIGPADFFILSACIIGGPIVGPLTGIIYAFASPFPLISAAGTVLAFPLGIYARLFHRSKRMVLWWIGYWLVLIFVYCPLETIIVTFIWLGFIPTGSSFLAGFIAISIAMAVDSVPIMLVLEALRKANIPYINDVWQ